MRKPKPIHAYVAVMAVTAIAAVWVSDWEGLRAAMITDDPVGNLAGFFILVIVGVIAEHQGVNTLLGDRRGSHSITFIPLSTSVVVWGPAAPVAYMAIVGTIAEFLVRHKPIDRGLFNISQYIVSAAVAGAVYGLGGSPAALVEWDLSQIILPFVEFGLVLLFLNYTFVSLAISLSQGTPFGEVLQRMAGAAGAAIVYDLLVSPFALVVAYLFKEAGWPGLILAVFPLLFIRHAYLLNFKLQQANRDLLKALVKAIETRDPYTSGHSLRVQALAGRIAGAMGLPEFRKRNIEQAALLHDIGKIESIYAEILQKPEKLSDEERLVIESHVTKGVELLTSISSFSKEVVDAVRYHHEREDGKGYPFGMRGTEIPLGAKIINVCDAVDAMLSDRPYREALPLGVVRSELLRYRGIQFDDRVVDLVVDGDLLEQHSEEIRASLDRLHTTALSEPDRATPEDSRSLIRRTE